MDETASHKELKELGLKLDYDFTSPEFLVEALRHASYVNEAGTAEIRDNERLEFLGDAVLSLAVSDILMDAFPEAKEGQLSKWRASLVNERVLFGLARDLDLGSYLLLGKGEELSGGRKKPSILADALESLLGAVYLDGGFGAAKETIKKLLVQSIRDLEEIGQVEDFKSLLQELTQETYKSRPEYFLIGDSGPAHDKKFKVSLQIQGKIVAEGEGKSKKEAEQRAAKEAFSCLISDRAGL
ncbi:MAG: ribonuclease III [Deltaproteobacteria bacterium]|nr:ribonuclease III [Deltaproteobacteria bacterium]